MRTIEECIKELKERRNWESPEEVESVFDEILEISKAERPKGKWERYDVDVAEHPNHCSSCGWSNHKIDRYIEEFNYCPKCGADMSEVEE